MPPTNIMVQGKVLAAIILLDGRFAHFYATVISSAEREASYMPDGVMHNYIIKSDIHSTDTHSSTEVVFGLMHFMGVTFAPRLKNLSDQTLYGFKAMPANNKDVIKPKKYMNTAIIQQNWDDVLRFASTVILRPGPCISAS